MYMGQVIASGPPLNTAYKWISRRSVNPFSSQSMGSLQKNWHEIFKIQSPIALPVSKVYVRDWDEEKENFLASQYHGTY